MAFLLNRRCLPLGIKVLPAVQKKFVFRFPIF